MYVNHSQVFQVAADKLRLCYRVSIGRVVVTVLDHMQMSVFNLRAR
jgi:hypothetical protein